MKWKFEASFENWERVWEELDQELNRQELAAPKRRQLLTAVEEMISNIIFYGGTDGRKARIELILEAGEMIRIEMIDDGRAFDPLRNPVPKLTEDARRSTPGGLGIYMARRLTDEIAYEYKEGKNHLILKKRRGK